MMNKTRPGQRLEAAREGGRTLQFRSYHGSSEGGREDAAVQRHVKNACAKKNVDSELVFHYGSSLGGRENAAVQEHLQTMLQSYHGSSEGGREDAAVQRHVKNACAKKYVKTSWGVETLQQTLREKKAEAVSSFHSKNEDRSKQAKHRLSV